VFGRKRLLPHAMTRRLVVFIIGLALLTCAVVYLVSVWLPEHGVSQVGPVLRVGTLLSRAVPPWPSLRILTPPTSERQAQPYMRVRPFGLHREGLPGLWWYVGSLVSLLILAIMALFLFPRRLGIMARVVRGGWGERALAFAVGLLGYLGIGLLTFLIFINVIGWPILLILILGVYVATAIGLVSVSLALGAAVCQFFRLDDRGPLFHLGVGVILLSLASMLPYLGWVVAGVVAVLGFGVVLWTRGGDTVGWSLDDVND